MSALSRQTIDVMFGNEPDVVTIRIGGSSTAIVGHVIDTDTDLHGNVERIYLRQLIVRPDPSTEYQGWIPTGCFTTILTRQQVSNS